MHHKLFFLNYGKGTMTKIELRKQNYSSSDRHMFEQYPHQSPFLYPSSVIYHGRHNAGCSINGANTAPSFRLLWLTSGRRNAIALAKELFSVSQGKLEDDITEFYCSVLQGQSTRAVVSTKCQLKHCGLLRWVLVEWLSRHVDGPLLWGSLRIVTLCIVLCNGRWLSVT